MNDDLWVGYLPSVGVVVFDATMQPGFDDDWVQLWDVGQGRFEVFEISVMWTKFIPLEKLLEDSTLGPILSGSRLLERVNESYTAALSGPDEADIEEPAEDDPTAQELEYDQYGRGEEDDIGDETELLLEELHGEQDSWARSDDEGWYYDE